MLARLLYATLWKQYGGRVWVKEGPFWRRASGRGEPSTAQSSMREPPGAWKHRVTHLHKYVDPEGHTGTVSSDLAMCMGGGVEALGLGQCGLGAQQAEAGHVLCHGFLAAARLPQRCAQVVPLL